MTLFWIVIALVVFAALLLIWVPHFRQQHLIQAETSGVRKQTNLAVFTERVVALEAELEQGKLEQLEFDALKQELEVSLLQDIKQAGDDSLDTQMSKKGIFWPSFMSVTLLIMTAYLYQQIGAYQALSAPAPAVNPHQGMEPEMAIAQRITMLEEAVKAQPENSQAWFSLGHAYITNSQYDLAVAAFDAVMALVGTQAELLGPKATALYYKHNKQITADTQAIIDESLTLDPTDPSTLLLVGMDAFFNARYQQAIDSWQLILSSERPDIDRAALINAIETAKLSLQKEAGPIIEKALEVKLDIDPAIATKMITKGTLYLFARTTTEPKTPIALTKLNDTTLPVTVTLDKRHFLSSDVSFSGLDQVEIIVLISKDGSLKPQAGDLQGKLIQGKFGETNNLVIDTIVK
jgi:cytochrome c-type biogenesis protein CcmH